jgi:hypothetical protein
MTEHDMSGSGFVKSLAGSCRRRLEIYHSNSAGCLIIFGPGLVPLIVRQVSNTRIFFIESEPMSHYTMSVTERIILRIRYPIDEQIPPYRGWTNHDLMRWYDTNI